MLRSAIRFFLPALLFTVLCEAQENVGALAAEVRAMTAALASQETLDTWQKSHPSETHERADYQADEKWPESDFRDLNSRCAFSVAKLAREITRAALFVVPLVTAGRLPPLPAGSDPALIQECRLEESWVEPREPVSLDSLVRALSSSWGEPNGPSRSFRDAVRSVGRRKDIVAWHRAGMNIWLVTEWQAPTKVQAVYARNDVLPPANDWYGSVGALQDKVRRESAPIMARNAALDPRLTQAVFTGATCQTGSPAPQEPPGIAEGRLEHWLDALKNVPAPRRAAALLLADYYVPCVDWAGAEMARYLSMGVEFDHDGAYIHTFRQKAKDLDPRGIAGQWAALHAFWEKCNIAEGSAL